MEHNSAYDHEQKIGVIDVAQCLTFGMQFTSWALPFGLAVIERDVATVDSCG